MRKNLKCIVCLATLSAASMSFAGDATTQIQPGHNLLSEQRAAVNRNTAVASMSFRDTQGNAYYSDEILEKGPAAFIFLSTKCPLAKRYTMRLRRMHADFASSGVQFFGVFPNEDETLMGVTKYADTTKLPFPCVLDRSAYLVDCLGAAMTPQVFLVDQNSRISYRGAIDDNRYENRIKEHYLVDALNQTLARQPVAIPNTKAMGCTIHRAIEHGEGDVTYSGHIARILQDNCQNCHRDGQVAPFSLTNYEEAFRWREEIQAYTDSRLMPPWKVDSSYAHYKNDMSLSQEQIDLIAKWVENGAPQGDETQVPPAPKYQDDWAFGEPDMIIEMPEEYVIGPEGEDDYRHFVIPFSADEHRFVKAVDVQPGNRNVVHHVIAYTDKSGEARRLDAKDEGPGYSRFGDVGFKPSSALGGWAPGNIPSKTPEGTGRWLPKECDIVLQVHYYRSGVEERDRTKIGIYFAKEKAPVAARAGLVINRDFTIKAGNSNQRVEAEYTVEESAYAYNITPHMHLIGETMIVNAHRPDGSILPMVKVDDWDFNWQNSYYFSKLHHLPKGTVVKLSATFDNSAENPNNPNSPPQEIAWGEKTTDEMCLAFFGLIREDEYDPITKRRRATPQPEKVAMTETDVVE